MKKRKNIKIIFNVFLSFILILLFFCGDLQVFADENVTIKFRLLGSSSYTRILSIYNVDNYPSNTRVVYQTFNTGANAYFDYTVSLPAGHTYSLQYYSETSAYRFMYLKFDFNGVELSRVRTSPTVVEDSSYILGNNYNETNQFFYYIVVPSVSTPTPEPTPTPTPAPTPTPLPVDYDDTQFWGRMNDMAEGGWSAITATFNGIFNNTVFRNLVVYVPLFGAIIYLFVYLLFMGSD